MGLMDEITVDEKKPKILVNGHFYLSYEVFLKFNLERLKCWNDGNNNLRAYAGLLSKDRFSLFVIQESNFSVEIGLENENFMISDRLNYAKVSFVENNMILINKNYQKKMIDFAIITPNTKWFFCGNFCYVEQDNKKFCLFQN